MKSTPAGSSLNIPQGILDSLKKIQDQNRFRTLAIGKEGMVDFTSNDYLGIRQNPKTLNPSSRIGGSGGSRLLGGNYAAHEALEAFAADWLKAESALLFNSGYDANIGLLSSLPGKDDYILYDERCHASLKDGIRLSLARKFPYRSLNDLANKLNRLSGNIYIVSEALFSMDGDWCPLAELVQLSRSRKNTWIVLDESHSTGIIGPSGSGLTNHLNQTDHILIRIHTFGKACGIAGAVVLAPLPIRDYLINFSRSFIYTTAMPPLWAETILSHLESTRNAEKERLELSERISYWNQISGRNFSSPIIPWIISGNTACKKVANQLQGKGFEVRAILSPSVPVGKERIRIILHVFNTREEIQSLYENLCKLNAE